MSFGSQAYAGLADDSYRDRSAGIRPSGEEERVTIEGVDYKILEHVDSKRTGYQGTIYRRVDGGEIVVPSRHGRMASSPTVRWC